MSNVSNVAPSPTGEQAAAVASNSAAGLSDEFMTLMIAQIQNQDPLDPTDGTEYVTQLAQLSQVEQLENLSTLQSTANTLSDTMSVLQSASLVGTSVSIPAQTLSLDQDDDVNGKIRLAEASDKVILQVKDLNGNVVKELNYGAQDAGELPFSLGELKAGNYQISVKSSLEGEDTASTAYLNRQVEKVSIPSSGGDISLTVSGVGTVSLFDVTEFLGDVA